MPCGCPKTCPSCGTDLVALQALEVGSLTIIANSIILWRGQQVVLSPDETIIVVALARAAGVRVSRNALAEAVNYDRDGDWTGVLNTHICHIRAKFRRCDPHFAQIFRLVGCGADGDTWWAVDNHLLSRLRDATVKQRHLHRLMLLNPRSSLHELAASAGLKHNTVWNHLQRLERRGLVHRTSRYQRGWTALGTLDLHRQVGDAV